MSDERSGDEKPGDELPGDVTANNLTPNDLTPSDAMTAKGLRGWWQRRADAMLRKPVRASAALTEPGDFHVVLQLIGAKPIYVIGVISQATGLDLVSASNVAKDAPVVVVSGISQSSADRVVERLQRAGAKAIVGEPYRQL